MTVYSLPADSPAAGHADTRSRRAARTLFALLTALLVIPAPLAAAGSLDAGSADLIGATGSLAPSGLERAENPDWMGGLPDDVGLSELSLPGTHDTMAVRASVFAETQDVDLPTQLRAGVRAVDIRTRHFRDAYPIHHGLEYLNTNFTDVVVQLTDFLRDHPTETVVMRLKEEYTPAENTRSYEDTLRWYLHDNPDTAARLSEHLWSADGNRFPTLGEVRGKIVVIQGFDGAETYGPRWGNAGMDIQDTYELTDLRDVDRKWDLVRAQFDRAAAGDPQTFFVNHLSATGNPVALVSGTVPVTVARGVPGTIGILARAEEHLAANPTGRTGAVMADYPTPELVDELVARNFR
ncbi:phosphatidylinositol-specific phospholipase C [Rhodococcus gannanensis]|uniref:1-phosphatidylinositol phosphodiesterase n=1 Tax=Rhodococcus gannanensis TaxID=1960308 RepID=A0ABW4P7Q5_9NOCA